MAETRMNSRMGKTLPDVAAWPHPLVDGAVRLIETLGAGRVNVDTYQARVMALFADTALRTQLAQWIERTLSERADQILVRRSLPGRDYTLQLLYLQAGEIHPPHCHHNVTSTQVLLHGAGWFREYERIARIDARRIRLLPVRDRCLQAGDVMQSSEFVRNAHWFGAGEHPAVILNFNIRGYERDTFDPPARLGRRLLDPTRGDPDGAHVIAAEIDTASAYDRFATRPLQDFPLPVPLAPAAEPLRLDLG